MLDPILAAQAMQAAARSASPAGRRIAAGPTTVPPAAGLNRPVTWTTGLQAGLEQAGKTSKPVLVRVGADWCGWCRKLDAEIRNPAVQSELARWTPVYLDADRASGDLDTLSVGPIPALRILTPGGRVVAGQDGYLSADALVRWLKAQYDQAAVMAPIELQSDQPPTPESLVKLIAQFENRDPVLREAAIRRLAGYPDLAAGAVTKAFATGRLSVRLASLELLESWKAPVTGMDPWRPETITPQRLEALRQWSAAPGRTAASRPTELEGAALAAARGELADYLKAGSPADAQAIRERL
ncbi:MAG: thioredoxin family protein, partial [Phycisphaerae bacterium]